jgi:prefoldin subunit 5
MSTETSKRIEQLARENEQLKHSLRELRDSLKSLLDANSESWLQTLHKVQTAEVLLKIGSDTEVAP